MAAFIKLRWGMNADVKFVTRTVVAGVWKFSLPHISSFYCDVWDDELSLSAIVHSQRHFTNDANTFRTVCKRV